MASNLHANAASAVNVNTTTETAIATLTAFNVNQSTNGEGVYVSGDLYFTAPTGATAATVRVRQGSGTGGAVVNNPTPVAFSVTAGNPVVLGFSALDSATVLANGQQYTVTVQFTGATANASVSGVICAQSCNSVE
jgi:hypothetical protein